MQRSGSGSIIIQDTHGRITEMERGMKIYGRQITARRAENAAAAASLLASMFVSLSLSPMRQIELEIR